MKLVIQSLRHLVLWTVITGLAYPVFITVIAQLAFAKPANGSLVADSVSTVDNLQHLWVPQLPAGRYDLQVWKAGGSSEVSTAEPYALAFDFFAMPLSIVKTATNVTLAWPVIHTGMNRPSA